MATFNDLSTTQLRQALELSEQIDTLQQRLKSLLGGSVSAAPAEPTGSTRTRKGMSAATRAKMRAAQQARWSKIKGTPAKETAPAAAAAAPKQKRGLTAEGRARLAAAMKARWAARKKGAPAPNASH
jgi:hypothetical protein